MVMEQSKRLARFVRLAETNVRICKGVKMKVKIDTGIIFDMLSMLCKDRRGGVRPPWKCKRDYAIQCNEKDCCAMHVLLDVNKELSKKKYK
jgi:hypothetical protein